MRQLRLRPATKHEGLGAFQRRGWVLVDATYQPVNILDARNRKAVIIRDYPLLRDDLRTLAPERDILIKANVCALLEPKLTAGRLQRAQRRQDHLLPRPRLAGGFSAAIRGDRRNGARVRCSAGVPHNKCVRY